MVMSGKNNLQEADFSSATVDPLRPKATQHVLHGVDMAMALLWEIYDAIEMCSKDTAYQTVEIITHASIDLFSNDSHVSDGLVLVYYPPKNESTRFRMAYLVASKLSMKKDLLVVTFVDPKVALNSAAPEPFTD